MSAPKLPFKNTFPDPNFSYISEFGFKFVILSELEWKITTINVIIALIPCRHVISFFIFAVLKSDFKCLPKSKQAKKRFRVEIRLNVVTLIAIKDMVTLSVSLEYLEKQKLVIHKISPLFIDTSSQLCTFHLKYIRMCPHCKVESIHMRDMISVFDELSIFIVFQS